MTEREKKKRFVCFIRSGQPKSTTVANNFYVYFLFVLFLFHFDSFAISIELFSVGLYFDWRCIYSLYIRLHYFRIFLSTINSLSLLRIQKQLHYIRLVLFVSTAKFVGTKQHKPRNKSQKWKKKEEKKHQINKEQKQQMKTRIEIKIYWTMPHF